MARKRVKLKKTESVICRKVQKTILKVNKGNTKLKNEKEDNHHCGENTKFQSVKL